MRTLCLLQALREEKRMTKIAYMAEGVTPVREMVMRVRVPHCDRRNCRRTSVTSLSLGITAVVVAGPIHIFRIAFNVLHVLVLPRPQNFLSRQCAYMHDGAEHPQ